MYKNKPVHANTANQDYIYLLFAMQGNKVGVHVHILKVSLEIIFIL